MLSWLEKHMLPCAYKSIFGIDCPICGFQRSLIELMKGHFRESFSVYPPLIPVLSLIGFSLLYLVNRRFIGTNFLKYYAFAVLIIVVFNYIMKF